MRTVAVSRTKGGVGATSITANLAAELAHRGRRVAALDADPQRSLAAWAGLGTGVLAGIVEPIEADALDGRLDELKRTADVVLIDCPPAFVDAGLGRGTRRGRRDRAVWTLAARPARAAGSPEARARDAARACGRSSPPCRAR